MMQAFVVPSSPAVASTLPTPAVQPVTGSLLHFAEASTRAPTGTAADLVKGVCCRTALFCALIPGVVRYSKSRRAAKGRKPASALAAVATANIVDVVDESMPGGGIVQTVLEKAEKNPLRLSSYRMQYQAKPSRSPLRSCGIPILEAEDGAQALVAELRGWGIGEHRADVAAAAVCLLLGGVDDAHNLVTPHCQLTPTVYGGLPIYKTEVVGEASYCNAIVHRMEGEQNSEYGTGFYQSTRWLPKGIGDKLNGFPTFSDLLAYAQSLTADHPEARSFIQKMGPNWDPYAFIKLCEDTLLLEDEELMRFCSLVQAKELRLLFDYMTSSGRAADAKANEQDVDV
eukprot:TRINITY_DN105518_c0_g1_i1.p1 TRINITY_DN105518_c0_g1~~TRINITY_DN105518_c0_g1_i1.p1  ORF type:complete len:342 (-),score=92.55 TRINITY_DN105518_c0_g1_i1:46-1071(-)